MCTNRLGCGVAGSLGRMLALGVALLLCGVCSAGRFVSITVLHTCDLHGHVRPTHDYAGNPDLGGLARCATKIRELRKKADNVLVLDVGDTLQGTPASLLAGGETIVASMNALGYDAWVLGNHEFDWGTAKLAPRILQAKMPVLNADLLPPDDAPAPIREALARVQSFVMREFEGVRVAVIGLNTPGIPGWIPAGKLEGVRFAEPIPTLKRAVRDAQNAGADVLVLAVHQGFRPWGDSEANRINAIASVAPELDVILGAHTHREHESVILDDTLYVQAGYHGITLGEVEIQYDKKRRRVSRRTSRLHRMTKEVRQDPEVLRICKAYLEKAERMLDERIGVAAARFDVKGAPARETAVHSLFFDSIRAALAKRGTKVDAVLHGVLDHDYALSRGPVTMREVWRIVPYENTIVVLEMRAKHLRGILDENAARPRSYKFLGIGGELKAALDFDAEDGKRLVSLTDAKGRAVEPDQRIVVAMNSYDFAGWRSRSPTMQAALEDAATRVEETDLDTRSAVAEFIRARKSVEPHVENGWRTVERGE